MRVSKCLISKPQEFTEIKMATVLLIANDPVFVVVRPTVKETKLLTLTEL